MKMAEILHNFPTDVLIDILSRLGAKDLCRFRCVSKQWLHLISDPHFIKSHRNQSNRNPRFLFSSNLRNSTRNLSMVAVSDHNSVSDNFSFNLDCKSTYRFMFGCDLVCIIDGNAVYVSNPSNHEVARLPECSHSSLSTAAVGLGYVASMNEYKIVHFYYLNDQGFNYEVGVEVYTLKEGRPNSGFWREVKNCPLINMIWVESSVVVDGSIYWLFTDEVCCQHKIVSFDLENEVFANVCCPRGYPCLDDGDQVSLIELRGFLCLAHYSYHDSVMNVWMLKDRETQFWVKEYAIDLHGMCRSCTALGYVPWDDHVGEISFWSSDESRLYGLFFFNIEEKRFRRVVNLTNPEDQLQCLYFDTMFSLRRQ